SLVGLHMEKSEVFDECHRLLRQLMDKGIVTGVRVDHIDGLWDPVQYLERLATLAPSAREPLYVLVEKILDHEEQLSPDWPVHGTSGYDFTASLIDLLAESRSEAAFTRIYHEFTGRLLDPREEAYQLKLFSMEELFSNTIESLALDLESHLKSDR